VSPIDAIPERLLEQARTGDAALGRLLELYGNCLRLAARALIGQALDPSLVDSRLDSTRGSLIGTEGRVAPVNELIRTFAT
jgi:hypothetical protein